MVAAERHAAEVVIVPPVLDEEKPAPAKERLGAAPGDVVAEHENRDLAGHRLQGGGIIVEAAERMIVAGRHVVAAP